jgi:hypothetical protein
VGLVGAWSENPPHPRDVGFFGPAPVVTNEHSLAQSSNLVPVVGRMHGRRSRGAFD